VEILRSHTPNYTRINCYGPLVHGSRPITADTALRLGLFFGMEPRFWLNLQSEYDMRTATRELKAKIAPRIRVFSPAAA
jgi:plasmid maintenance system antidote protein VapI